MLSYGLLLFVVVAALYFSPDPDSRDMNPMPARRIRVAPIAVIDSLRLSFIFLIKSSTWKGRNDAKSMDI
jgi:hypothetical protein